MTTETSAGYVVDLGFDEMIANNTMPTFRPIISEDFRQIFIFVARSIICQILAIIGMSTNIVNILVFYKMGFKESINISLFGLAISDFMSCATVAWGNLCFTPAFHNLDLPFRAMEIKYLTGGIPHTIFIKVTGCITAFITFERCICVTFPLKVKSIITPKRVTVLIVSFYIFALGLYASVYYVCRLTWKFYPHLNRTLLGVVFLPNRWEVEKWVLPIRGVFLTWFLFTFIIVFTVVLVLKLKKNSEWREKAAATSKANQMISSRDTKVSTLVVFISVVFIACFTPQLLSVVAMSLEEGISVGGKYNNLMAVIFAFNFNLESINASLNISIYYFRSSKYKAAFDQMFFKKSICTKH